MNEEWFEGNRRSQEAKARRAAGEFIDELGPWPWLATLTFATDIVISHEHDPPVLTSMTHPVG